MPSVERILNGLTGIANSWGILAVFWHVYFGAIALALLLGLRPTKRASGYLLVPPILAVSAIAWASRNLFNGMVFAALGILLLLLASGLPRESISGNGK